MVSPLVCGCEKIYVSLAGSEASFLCLTYVMGQQSCVIAAMQEVVKFPLTTQLAELYVASIYALEGATFNHATTASNRI